MGSGEDERLQPALTALRSGDPGRLRAVLDADPAVVNVKVGNNTMLEWMTQPAAGPP